MKIYRSQLKQYFHLMLICFLSFSNTYATNYYVGPSQTYKKVQDVSDLLHPGDSVLVDGSTTYPADIHLTRSGASNNWIVIRGITPLGSTPPLIEGNAAYGFNIEGDYIIVEGFKVTEQPKGIGVFGDSIIIRGCIVNDCNHGLIGYGTGTGNITVEYCEFYGNGNPTGGATQHQIYMATDEYSHPGSVFRLQYCYLHDGVQGDNVKSRAERNEIYYNWIENAGSIGHGLGLFAPDPDDNSNVSINTAREDADVVGNVIIQPRNACARIGGDLPGYPTNGRYRFVNNTFILTGTRGDAIRTFNTVETLEMYNNVIYATNSASDIRILNDADGSWCHSPRSVIGSHNWVISGATNIPAANEWTNTTSGSTSPFANASIKDFTPGLNSVLINNGTANTPTITLYPFLKPLFPPTYIPPKEELITIGNAESRPDDSSIDIGAYEFQTNSINKGNQLSQYISNISCYPQPFTHTLFMSYNLIKQSEVTISIYTCNGLTIKRFPKKWMTKGVHTLEWNGLISPRKSVKSGVYIITIEANGGFVGTTIFKN